MERQEARAYNNPRRIRATPAPQVCAFQKTQRHKNETLHTVYSNVE